MGLVSFMKKPRRDTRFNLEPAQGIPLQERPLNHDIMRLFVAATRQNEGKTTTCLGLFGMLQTRFPKVGYIKPIGQRLVQIEEVQVDEDSYLLDLTYDVDIPIEAMSPVALESNFTRRYLKGEIDRAALVHKISRAFDRAAYEKDAIIIEGSGHAGVGAICDLSNAQVAKLLGAKAILVSSGGIGRPVDEIALNKSHFDAHGVEVVGAILNKVNPDKLEMIREFASIGLERMGIPLLGVVPESRQLSAPNLGQIVSETGARWICGKENGERQRIDQIIIGAMAAKGIIDLMQPGVLIITPGDRDDVILAAMASSGLVGKPSVSGILLTRNVLPHPKLMELLGRTQIPVALCREDSYAVASAVHSMPVKTQPQDTEKIPIIQKLMADHVDLDRLLKLFGYSK
jgi:BioD-like phosphotransacetylase family protein